MAIQRIGNPVLVILGLAIGIVTGCGTSKVSPLEEANALKVEGIEKFKKRHYDEALKCFKESAQKFPSADTWACAGDCLYFQGKLEQADRYYVSALEVDPNTCGANFALGRDAVILKRYDKAIAYLEKANTVCKASILHPLSLRFLVEAYLGLGQIDRAEASFEKLQPAYPNDSTTAEAGLLIAVKKGDESAAEGYRKMLKEAVKTEAGNKPSESKSP